MNILDKIDQLAERAREEQIPVRSVSDNVLERISATGQRRFSVRSLAIFAAASGIAATVLLCFALNFQTIDSDPVSAMFEPVQDVQLW